MSSAAATAETRSYRLSYKGSAVFLVIWCGRQIRKGQLRPRWKPPWQAGRRFGWINPMRGSCLVDWTKLTLIYQRNPRERRQGAQFSSPQPEEEGIIGQACSWQGIPGCTQSQGAGNGLTNDGRGAHLGHSGESGAGGRGATVFHLDTVLCPLGYIQICIADHQVWVMIDSWLIVNLLPTELVCNADLVHRWVGGRGMEVGKRKRRVSFLLVQELEVILERPPLFAFWAGLLYDLARCGQKSQHLMEETDSTTHFNPYLGQQTLKTLGSEVTHPLWPPTVLSHIKLLGSALNQMLLKKHLNIHQIKCKLFELRLSREGTSKFTQLKISLVTPSFLG
ncbi:hypothetical protein VP01_2638g1 [Puccinia sorghi]|uniref:Uncharacterized protein n=1 Tax=Puccinia sorghi TaxID=27349 RepID=A0A0L6V4Z0_9BASI|nr:hypothetical protein VP01_2638g1 [Puccinia sorghi]